MRAGALAHHLDGVHHVGGFRRVGRAEGGSPVGVCGELVHHGGEGHEGFHAGVPRLGVGGIDEGRAGEVAVAFEEAARLVHIVLVGGRSERQRHELVGEQRDRRHQCIELLGRGRLVDRLLRYLGGARARCGRRLRRLVGRGLALATGKKTDRRDRQGRHQEDIPRASFHGGF